MAAAMDDVCIVGSGFGGAVAAYELSLAGWQVRLLERGPWRNTLPMRSAVAQGLLPAEQLAPLPQGRHFFSHGCLRLHHPWLPAQGLSLHRHGLLEVFADKGIRAVCASGVGGGSHAYGGLHARPLRADYWDGHHAALSSNAMAPHYDAMLALFQSAPAPNAAHPLRQGQPVQAWEQDPSSPFHPLAPEQEPHWGYLLAASAAPQERQMQGLLRREADFQREGMFGSPDGGKTTLDATCILPAMARGLVVEAQTTLERIVKQGDGSFCLYVRQGKALEQRWAKRVILAAGALNTCWVLMRSQAAGGLASMPALGQGFASNGDSMAYFPVRTPGAAHSQHGMYQRIFAHQDDPLGPVFLQTGLSGLGAVPIMGALKRYLDRDLFISAMGIDAVNGQLQWQNGRLRLHYQRDANPVFARIDAHLERLGALSGQRLFSSSTVTTVHPLGGARVGSDAASSVVDGWGQVHQNPGLYVADASVLPAALGSPPSLSIAAWARHVAQGLLGQFV